MSPSSSAKAYRQRYYQENKEKIKARAKQYYWDNRDEVLLKLKESKEKALYSQDYYLINKEKIRKSQQLYYQKNKDKKLASKFDSVFEDTEIKKARYLTYTNKQIEEPKPNCVICEVFMI